MLTGYNLGCSEFVCDETLALRIADQSCSLGSYVPISPDYTDLWSAMAFFRGDDQGRGSHDEMAKEIASSGKLWAKEFWRWEDMQVCEFCFCGSPSTFYEIFV